MMFERRDVGNVRFAAAVSDPHQRDNPIEQSTHDAAMATQWQALLRDEGAVTLQPHQTQRILIDFDNYYCFYTQLMASGAGTVQTRWVESLKHEPNQWRHDKGHRDEIDGKFVIGNGDVFKVSNDAPEEYMPLWWSAGRYVEVCAQAATPCAWKVRLHRAMNASTPSCPCWCGASRQARTRPTSTRRTGKS